MSEIVSQDWAARLVAKWCEDRAVKLHHEAKQAKQAYRTGPLAEPCQRYAILLDEQALQWEQASREFLNNT